MNPEEEIQSLKKTLEEERRKLTRLKEAYDMQIDLREALEEKIDKLKTKEKHIRI